MRLRWVAAAGILACALGCAGKPAARKEKEKVRDEDEGASTKEATGVRDFVDYATGKTQVETYKRLKKKMREIESRREREAREAMGE